MLKITLIDAFEGHMFEFWSFLICKNIALEILFQNKWSISNLHKSCVTHAFGWKMFGGELFESFFFSNQIIQIVYFVSDQIIYLE